MAIVMMVLIRTLERTRKAAWLTIDGPSPLMKMRR
jgi:hypothetical protein